MDNNKAQLKENLRFTRTIKLNEGDVETKRKEILDYFHNTFTIYEELFTVINNPKSYYSKAEPLRHPLIFYLGHTATFFINKLTLAGLVDDRINSKFEGMFSVGVDEMDWDDLNEVHYDWPTVEEVMEYRNKVREVVDQKIKEFPISFPINWDSPMWIIMMGIEHERIHLETSAVIIRRLPIEEVHSEPLFPRCDQTNHVGYDENGSPAVRSTMVQNELLPVEEGTVELGKTDGLYGWDNEYGQYKSFVGKFKASKYLVSNFEFLQFMEEDGYSIEKYWTVEGWKWNRSTKMTRPLFWVPDRVINEKQTYKFRTFTEIIDMPWDWPVELNNLESKAFCNWKAAKTGKPIRLPTEDEWYRLRAFVRYDQIDWKVGTVGNINLEKWASSCPIDIFSHNGFYDIIGNVWQHTETPIDGHDGFKVHPLYDDFSTPTFDTKHNLIKGGSWISTGNEATKSARYSFRRHFYQNAGIRYVESATPVVIKDAMYEADTMGSMYLEFHYGAKNLGVENYPKKCADICIEVAKKHNIPMNKALDLGCAVGRSTFDLGKEYKEVVGIDLSARFFQLALKLRDQGKLRYTVPEEGDIVEYKEIDIKTLGYEDIKDNVSFYQQDATILDIKKFNNMDLIFCGNLIDRMRTPKKFLENIHLYLKEGGIFVNTSPYTWLTDWTDKKEWVGGFKENGENFTTYKGLQRILKAHFVEIEPPRDVEFVIKETKRKFQHTFAHATFWKKVSN
jgi:5-histidylcysteine sulfoxide synthase/putative 4-mercaptohistidine N1-methyltranferase